MKGFIFDLDGVIVDTAKFHFKAWKKLADELGFRFTEAHNEQLKGVSRVRSLEILLKIGNITIDDQQKADLLREKNERYLAYISKMTEKDILPGIYEVLTYLKKRQIPVALGSASKNAGIILKALHLEQFFDAVVDGNMVHKAKPDPEVFTKAAGLLHCSYQDCIVIEDSVAGIQAANNAGMTSVGIGSAETLHEADYILPSTAELTIDFIKKLINE